MSASIGGTCVCYDGDTSRCPLHQTAEQINLLRERGQQEPPRRAELGDGEPSPPPYSFDVASDEEIARRARGAAQEVSPREPQLVEVPEPAWKPPEPDVIVVDRVPSVMNNAELTDLIHSAAHELFRRLEPKFYDRKE